MRLFYYYVAATQLKVHRYNSLLLHWMCIAEYYRDKGNTLNYLWDLSKHAAAYDNCHFIKTSSWSWSFPGDVFMHIPITWKSL